MKKFLFLLLLSTCSYAYNVKVGDCYSSPEGYKIVILRTNEYGLYYRYIVSPEKHFMSYFDFKNSYHQVACY